MAEPSITKTCRTCKQAKPLDFFNKRRSAKDGREGLCKACHNADCSARAKTAEARATRKLLLQRPEIKARRKAEMADWYQRNRHYVSAKKWLGMLDNDEARQKKREDARRRAPIDGARRRARQRLAVPVWADRDQIRAIYAGAKRMIERFGRQFQVDHIVPLQSQFVCGLHCPANLQVLEKAANLEKSNQWWPDMWANPRRDEWQ